MGYPLKKEEGSRRKDKRGRSKKLKGRQAIRSLQQFPDNRLLVTWRVGFRSLFFQFTLHENLFFGFHRSPVFFL